MLFLKDYKRISIFLICILFLFSCNDNNSSKELEQKEIETKTPPSVVTTKESPKKTNTLLDSINSIDDPKAKKLLKVN
jgi:PBP1b-binding outer membrane lipoprotein LpoB